MSLDTFFASLTSNRAVIADANDPQLFNQADINAEDSKNYQWSGPQVTSNVGDPIPVVYGRHRITGNIINAYLETGDVETLNLLVALCEGPINSVSNVALNGNSIENYYGVQANDPYGKNAEITFKKGELNQTIIQEFGDIHSYTRFNNLLHQNEQFYYESESDQLMAFVVEVSADMLYQYDKGNNGQGEGEGNGNKNKISWYFAVKIEYRVHGETNWTLAGVHEVNVLSETQVRRFAKSEYLPPNKYDIRVTKLSEDGGNGQKFGDLRIVMVDEIVNLELQYPYVAVLGMRLIATDKISQDTPNITCEVEGRLVEIPDVRYVGDPIDWEDYYYDSATSQFKRLDNDAVCTWDGTTYISAFSANPVWCLKDLLLNTRYGLGSFSTAGDLDEASFLASALYCEEGVTNIYGKKEKRTRLDIVLDKNYSAPDIINQIASTFRGLLSTDNGKRRLIIEKAEPYKQIFNMGNIIKDSFSMLYHSSKEIPNVLVFDYTNKDKNYSRDQIEVTDETSILAGNPIRQDSIQFFGCTRVSQLIREGKILLAKVKNNTRSISFSAFTDALTCQAGDVIKFQHDTPLWGLGGRVKTGSTASLIKLDKQVSIQSGITYKIAVRNNVDDSIEERTVTNAAGLTDTITVSAPFGFAPAQYDLWILGESNNFCMEYRITSITKANDGSCRISAVQYTASVYDSTAIVMPEDDFSYISLEIPAVYNLSVKELATRDNDGTIRDSILVTWTRPPNSLRWIKKAVRFHVYYSDNEAKSWVHAGVTESEGYTITVPFSIGRTYTIAVCTETDTGDKAAPANSPQDSVTIIGWISQPVTVENFYYSFRDTIILKWNKNPESDLSGYEIRTEDADWGQDDPQLIFRGKADTFVIDKPAARSGITYYIKAYNSSRIYSATAASVTPVNLAPAAPVLMYTALFQKAFLLWNDVPDNDILYYEVWRNDNDDWIGVPSGNEEMAGEITGTSSVQILPYDRTYFRIRARDTFGPGAWSNSLYVDTVLIGEGDINDDIIGEQNLKANSVTASKILAGSIQSAHIAVKAILAEQIDVENLSAMSAHLGDIESGNIVGAVIKTSNFDYRMEINQTGLFGYDSNGTLRTKLVRGELCLIDPNNSDFYTYLDSGNLKFHHPYGTVPYVKRIKSGQAVTGETVFLSQWYEQPEITVSIQKLSSYKTANQESNQEWRVYHDNLRYYNNGGADFGYAFDVHSKLVISGGTAEECIWLCNFDQTVLTVANTKNVLIKGMFQLNTHAAAPAHWCYGVECYEVRYRIHGSSVWCSYEFLYTQPSASIDLMNCTQVMCHTIVFPTSNQWDIQLHRISLNWFDSGIPSGTTVCCWCCFQYSVDCSYWYWQNYSVSQSASIGCNYVLGWTTPLSRTCSASFPGAPGGVVYCSYLSAKVDGFTDFGGVASWPGGSSSGNRTFTGTYISTSAGYISGISSSVDASGGPSARASVRYVNANMTVCYRCCQKCCVICCKWCCYQYEVYLGDPVTTIYEKLYSTQDTTDAEEILDGEGVVNYLAVSYG